MDVRTACLAAFTLFVVGMPLIAVILCARKYRLENRPHIIFLQSKKRGWIDRRIDLLIRRRVS